MNGSPVYPVGHVHIGIWLTTAHIAPEPHEPGQGSLHLVSKQALSLGHSEFMVHSGLQFGGCPIYVSKHVHAGVLPMFLHCEKRPQGDGTQGSFSTTSGIVMAENDESNKRKINNVQINKNK